MTENATQFVTPLTFEHLVSRRVYTDTFDRLDPSEVAHIALAERADLAIVAPATANICAKIAHGLADDMLSSTLLACRCPRLIAPAMNTNMLENPVTADNLETLCRYGWTVIPPAVGRLACGSVGAGKLPEPEVLLQYVLRELAFTHDLAGKKVLVTAGPTQEPIDPVRFLSNRSSGKMGYAIARMAMLRGADVTLISGKTALEPPMFVDFVPVTTAEDMYNAVTERFDQADFVIKAAAVADYTPEVVAQNKIKKKDGDLSIPLRRTRDILKYLGEQRRPGQVIVGFSMESENVLENSRDEMQCLNRNGRMRRLKQLLETDIEREETDDMSADGPLMTWQRQVNGARFALLLEGRTFAGTSTSTASGDYAYTLMTLSLDDLLACLYDA